ncbi:uncharacterized protein LOC106163560 [Lingula anatina]|uniref:Uncharacterized protein LOC106163560 n=1 Tax=Lingula anatina TaxID=7574 RepID=A0A1S3IEI5_LINAN|nr:uncharacterized protein LOC106163560 [Lingula anatina]|eukprot:XP_013396642.1 uncharacterized protein LOC106163560 [Lingula anatina]
MSLLSNCIVLGWFLATVNSHSWLTCVDYLEENGHFYSHDLCRAYPRGAYPFYAPKDIPFGTDRGFNHQPTEAQACITERNDGANYNSDYPRAVYYPGQRVVIAHPTKNHVADTCTNPFIPDNGNWIYFYPTGETGTDPTLSTYRSDSYLLVDFGVAPTGQGAAITTYPKKGFQNAPKFCEPPGTDKALATYAFDFPEMPPGTYSFMWLWEFNQGSFYSGCWEAEVVATKADRDSIYQGRNQPTRDPDNIAGVRVEVDGYGPYKPPGATTLAPGETTPAPINGNWGDWSQWSACSVTCGGGERVRIRMCNNPAPENGGATCPGLDEERECNCEPTTCAVNSLSAEPELQIKFDSVWDTGMNVELILPNPKPDDFQVIVKFPCAAQAMIVWHAEEVGNSTDHAQYKYIFTQSGVDADKLDIGFTATFDACTVNPSDLLAYIVVP